MATDIERLVVRMEADINKFTKAMDKATADTNRYTKKIEDDFFRLNGNLKSQLDGLGGIASAGVSKLNVALAAIGVGISLKGIQDAADEYKTIFNTLRAGGVGEGDLQGTFDKLFAVAQRNGAPVADLAQLFGRVSSAQKELGVSTDQIIGLTDRVGQALRINGTSAQQASGALLQLSQTLGGGKVQAEEYNSLIDGLRPLLEAAAAGMVEAGGSVAKLTQLVKDGEVSSKAFFAAIEAGSPILDQKLANAEETVGQATTRMKNEFIVAVAEFDRLTGASGGVAAAMNVLSGAFLATAQGAANLVNGLVSVIQTMQKFLSVRAKVGDAASLGGFSTNEGIPGLDQTFDASPVTPEDAKKQINYARASADALAAKQELDRETARGNSRFRENLQNFDVPQPPPKLKPISAKDPRYAAPAKATGGGGGGGGRGAAAAVDDEDAFDRQLAGLERRRLALENDALTIGKRTFEIERSKAAFDLLRAAEEAELPVTDTLKSKINEAAEAYARAKVNVEEITKAHQEFNQIQQFVGTSISGFFSDIVSGGENAKKALSNLVKKMSDAALQAALLGSGPLGSLFGLGGKNGAPGGLIGALFSAFSAPGRATGGPVSAGRLYTVGENGRELFVPSQPGRIIPNAALRGGGGSVSNTYIFNAPGADAAGLRALQLEVRAIKTGFGPSVAGVMRNMEMRGIRP